MSTQRTSKPCKSDGNYCRFGAETLLNRLEGIEDLIEGVKKNTSIEFVHKTRVTSRRLRAALPLFCCCFPKKEYKKWMMEIKKVTRLLADARDLDVQITFVEQYIKKLNSPPERAGMNTLLRDHKNRRKRVQSSVVEGLEELQGNNILEEIHARCELTRTDQSNNCFRTATLLEKAHWQISLRLDDFLSMDKYVYIEKEKLRHHQMRIYAKKLRYTMECFAPLYASKLDDEIETIKTFQDVIGEMHDCDVWMDYIPKFRAKIKNAQAKRQKTAKSQTDKALHNFSIYIKLRRKNSYRQFTDMWTNKKEKGFFDELRKTTSVEFMTATQKAVSETLKKPDLKIAVLSDVHANLQALQKVIADAEERGVDVILNAGDAIGFGANPNEVVELLCEKSVLSIVGNYDVEVLEGENDVKGEKKRAYKFTKKELAKSCEGYLRTLPRELRLEAAGKKILVTHGSPESIDEHVYHNTPVKRLKVLADEAKADLIVVGHSHEQFQREVNGIVFVNPGSVGRPNDGNPQTSYAVISLDPFNIELVRLNYDVEDAVGKLRKKGLPENFSQMLLKGVSLDVVAKDDIDKEDTMSKNCLDAVKASEAFARSHWPDVEHYKQVTSLALALFDGLSDVHKMGQRERCWLECAAILHDVGLSKSSGKHHKQSAKLILNDTTLPFSSKTRRVIASIARYHRKGLPKPKHYNLTSLNPSTVQKLCILASLLRVADSLDYTHQAGLKVLGVDVEAKRVVVECFSKTDLTLEEEAFNRKKDLFENVFAKKMVLTWKQR